MEVGSIDFLMDGVAGKLTWCVLVLPGEHKWFWRGKRATFMANGIERTLTEASHELAFQGQI